MCQDDVLTKTSEVDDWTYIIHSGSTAVTRSSPYTQTASKIGVCPLTATLEFLDDLTNTFIDQSAWSNSAFDTTSGDLTVLYTVPPTKPFEEHFVRIVVKDLRSVSDIATVSWTFTLQLRD